MKGWVPFAMAAVSEMKPSLKFDAIVTTSPPESCHLIGSRVKKALNCPWVADFRDLWTQDLTKHYGPIRKFVESRLERRTLCSADALVTLSGPWAEKLKQRYPHIPIYSIANAFDPDEFSSNGEALTDSFSITYTGQLYSGKRDPTPLLEVLGELLQANIIPRQRVRIRFYGPIEPWLYTQVQQHRLDDVVEIHATVGREQVLKRQAESQLLLLLGWNDPKDEGQHTGKIFEYFGAKRPILAIGGCQGVMTELLKETRAGIHTLSRAQLREFLIDAYTSFQRDGRVCYQGDQQAINRHTHREMASKFALLLDRVKMRTQTPATVEL